MIVSKKDLKRYIVFAVMLVAVCGVAFLWGYNTATANTVTVANNIIKELIKLNPTIPLGSNEVVSSDGFMFNLTTKELVQVGD